jgi:hypothetical protein
MVTVKRLISHLVTFLVIWNSSIVTVLRKLFKWKVHEIWICAWNSLSVFLKLQFYTEDTSLRVEDWIMKSYIYVLQNPIQTILIKMLD